MSAHILTFEGIGVPWQIHLFTALPNSTLQALSTELQKCTAEYDHTYSRFKTESWISQIGATPGTYPLPATALPLLKLYDQLYQVTQGAFTPLIGSTLESSGYDAQYLLQPGEVRSPPAWEDALKYTSTSITTLQPLTLDLGAAGKGYLIDLLAKIIRSYGVTDFCIDGSGDYAVQIDPTTPLRIGLENPNNPEYAVGVVPLHRGSLCSTAGNRRKWNKYHHIIHPHSLESPKNIQATWVITDSALLADALATALFLVEPDILMKHFSFSFCRMMADNTVETSPQFPGDILVS